MQVTTEKVGPCTIALDIHIEAEKVSRAFERAYREFSRYANVPGFRPGKAPRKVLERFVNQDRLRERVMDLIATPAFQEAVKQEAIIPFREPEVEFADLAEGQPWQFKATVATAPQVTLGDYSSGFVVERPTFSVTDEDVQRQIENLRSEHARLRKVEERGIQKGDMVIAEMAVALVGEEAEVKPQRTLIHVGNNIPGFDEAILGQMPEEERTFTLTFPEDYQDPERAGKEATFTLKVVTINERILPELTDAWVKSVTPHQTVEELRAAIRKSLEDTSQSLADSIVRSHVIHQLIQCSTLEYPPVLVQEEIEYEMNRLHEKLAESRLSYERYLAINDLTEEQHRAQIAEQAENNVRTRLVLRELARKEGITVSDAEIDAEFDRLFEGSDADVEELKSKPSNRERVAGAILERKLNDCLMQIARITDMPVDTR